MTLFSFRFPLDILYFFSFSISILLSATYNYEVNSQDDPIVQTFEAFAAAAVPVATLEQSIILKLFPFRKPSSTIITSDIHICLLEVLHIPDWLLGSSLKCKAKHACDLSEKLTEIPYQYIEECMVSPLLPHMEFI
ncbi:hypothetical protein J3R83DRAFT_1453 [Lanmaoa asiatica]|nr:hypothetical protein J3R83DRAFT_1453 [Lanmaoa asiatica]